MVRSAKMTHNEKQIPLVPVFHFRNQ